MNEGLKLSRTSAFCDSYIGCMSFQHARICSKPKTTAANSVDWLLKSFVFGAICPSFRTQTTDRKFISCATGYTTDPDRKKQTSRAQRIPIQSNELTHAKNAYACYMSQGQHVAQTFSLPRDSADYAVGGCPPVCPSVRPSHTPCCVETAAKHVIKPFNEYVSKKLCIFIYVRTSSNFHEF